MICALLRRVLLYVRPEGSGALFNDFKMLLNVLKRLRGPVRRAAPWLGR